MNNKIEARQQKTEESELKEKDEMERTGESGVACGTKLEQREIYEALVEGKRYCYLAPFSPPKTDLFSHSILPFFTFNLDHPNGSITHVGLPPQDVCEGRGCVRAAGWALRAATPWWCLCFEAANWLKMGFYHCDFLFYVKKSYSIVL